MPWGQRRNLSGPWRGGGTYPGAQHHRFWQGKRNVSVWYSILFLLFLLNQPLGKVSKVWVLNQWAMIGFQGRIQIQCLPRRAAARWARYLWYLGLNQSLWVCPRCCFWELPWSAAKRQWLWLFGSCETRSVEAMALAVRHEPSRKYAESSRHVRPQADLLTERSEGGRNAIYFCFFLTRILIRIWSHERDDPKGSLAKLRYSVRSF